MAENSTKANLIARILFIIGGVILFILLAIFIIRLVPAAISGIANIGSSFGNNVNKAINGDEIIVTSNTDSVENGSPVVINFEYTPEVPGQYFISYTCSDGLFYDILSSNGPKRIICNTPFKLGENLSAISLVPIVTKPNIFIDSTVKIEYKDSQNNPVAEGSKLITIKSESVSGESTQEENPFGNNGTLTGSTVTTAEVTPTRPPAPAPRPTTPTYVAPVAPTRDLAITQIFRGTNDSSFVFHVYNLGNTATGIWEFTYTDAENPSSTIVSPVQPSLGAGQGLAVTVRFDGQRNSSQVISVFADPYNRINETNETNNYSTVTITGNSNGGNTGGGSYDPNDDADLVITQLEVGRMSGNRFVEDDQIDEDDTSAVRFIVKNEGGENTGSWRFEISNLPYNRDDEYRSGTYQSLRPGQSIEIIAEFDGIDEGSYTIRVEVDSDDDVDEESENNNTRSRSLDVRR